MIGRQQHLHDDRLYECYLADQFGELPDPSCADHLTSCAVCRDRFSELAGFLEGIRDEADAEADEVFTHERLADQHAHIMRRVDAHPGAKIISFPGRVSRDMTGSTSRVAPRWLAAAAAAGLFVGVAVGGMFLNPEALIRRSPAGRMAVAQPTNRVAPVPVPVSRTITPPQDASDDDAFLMELEAALQRPHTRELQAYDALTPHVREIGSRTR